MLIYSAMCRCPDLGSVMMLVYPAFDPAVSERILRSLKETDGSEPSYVHACCKNVPLHQVETT